ncbi:MAG: hypothetical protein C0608_11965 [Deltaproteobacteria bacterium]|nr:MAG: hypothetical protein C0608_11965 [Deltaproteobacteria bacterium]
MITASKNGSKAPIIIPAFAPSHDILLGLVSNLEELGFDDFIIVDDGSGPVHEDVFSSLEKNPKVKLLRHAVNLGKGAALRTGFNEVLNRGGEVAVTVDADGQHHPEDVLKVALEAIANPGKLVLGRRSGEAQQPLRSKLGNMLTAAIFKAITCAEIHDTQTGLRAWPADLMRQSLTSTRNGYDFETETLLESLHSGVSWLEVPIRKIYFDGNAASHFSPIRDSFLIYWVLVRFSAASIAGSLLDYILFTFAYWFLLDIPVSIVISRVGATLFYFVMARNMVFRQKRKRALIQFVQYIILVAVLGAISAAAISYMHAHWGIQVLIAKAISEGLLLFVSFGVQRHIIFFDKCRAE